MKKDKMNPPMDSPITVTQPSLPPLDEFLPYLEIIWNNKRLTNRGPFHNQFEDELSEYLGVEHLALFTNGTIALVTAMQSLRVTGEVITTPYSFVATAHSLLWNNIKPVFADIDPISLNLDPKRIEEAITPQTSAILPVHVYGRPCDMEAIQKLADIYGLKVIYDAAHAFGVKRQGESILKHGDLSILSFHATKVFSTFEGGAIVCPDAKTKQRIDYLKNFGFANEITVVAPGINGKMNEFQAALGLLQLKHIDKAISRRREIHVRYSENIRSIKGLQMLSEPNRFGNNYSYFPVLVEPEYKLSRDELYEMLKDHGIFARRYFYPLISEFPMYRGLPSARSENLPVAYLISRKIICLPIYPALKDEQINSIVFLLRQHSGNSSQLKNTKGK
jgi:dTDP-4-amino-4,6-dideoxygalactose transaminase